jgi:hypothetical protein
VISPLTVCLLSFFLLTLTSSVKRPLGRTLTFKYAFEQTAFSGILYAFISLVVLGFIFVDSLPRTARS